MRTLSRLRLPSTQGKQELLPRSIPLCNANTSPTFLFNHPFKQLFVCPTLHYSAADRSIFPPSISPSWSFILPVSLLQLSGFSPCFAKPSRLTNPTTSLKLNMLNRICARMAELADALASGASGLTVVEVRVLFRAPIFS